MHTTDSTATSATIASVTAATATSEYVVAVAVCLEQACPTTMSVVAAAVVFRSGMSYDYVCCCC